VSLTCGQHSVLTQNTTVYFHTVLGFSTTSRLNGDYILNETRHRQHDKGVGKHEGSPMSENFVNFGPQMG